MLVLLALLTHAAETREHPLPNVLETEHFAIRWGWLRGFDEEDLQIVADSLEYAWDAQVGELGFPAPVDAYRLDVFIADTGPDAPPSYGARGYFDLDDGVPFIVLNPDTVAEPEQSVLTAGHEFFHAVQHAAGAYALDGPGGWWMEATAVWVENYLYPTNPRASGFAWALAFRPELAIDHFVYPSSGAVEEYHLYGAYLYPLVLAEREGVSIIRASFGHGSDADPLTVLQDLGVDTRGAFLEMADRNATWDYASETASRDWIDRRGGWDSELSHRPTGILRPTATWTEPVEPVPQSWGAAYWLIPSLPSDFQLDVDLPGDTEWHVAVATVTDGEHALWPLPAGENSLVVRDLEPVDEAWVVVAALGPRDEQTAWTHRLALTELDPGSTEPAPRPPSDENCGCTYAPRGGGLLLFLIPLLGRLRGMSERS